jgi:hypothetical protein
MRKDIFHILHLTNSLRRPKFSKTLFMEMAKLVWGVLRVETGTIYCYEKFPSAVT